MKQRIYIFNFLLLFIFAGLHVHPLFVDYGMQAERTCSIMTSSDCGSKKRCAAPIPSPDEDDCKGGCNPFLPCSMGSCCYLAENIFSISLESQSTRQMRILVNDNRLQGNYSECWHPPEQLSRI